MDITEKFEKLVDEHHQKDANGEPIPHDDEEGISEGTALQVKMALDDVGLKGKWKNNKVYVKKKDVEKAKKALKGNVIYKGKPPEVVGEEAEINEYGKIYAKKGSDYELYHKTFSAAMQHAYAHAKKKGFTVDPKEIDNKVATGPKKPSKGKTNRYILGTDKRKKVHIQVANLDNKRYELNMYIESAINHSAIDKVKKMLIKEKYVTQDKMFPKTLMDGIPKAIPGVKLSRYSIKHPRTGKNIPGLGLMLPGDKGIRVMIQFDKEDAPAPKGMPKTITDIDPDTGKKEVTDTSFRDSYAVWINDIGKIWKPNVTRWIQAKDFRDPSKVVQFLKTKVKRMVKSGYMYSSYKKEEVELDEKTYFNIKKFGPVKPVTSRSMYLFARKLYDWANENAGANKKELKAIAKKIEKENKLPDFKEMPEIVQSMMTQEFGIKEEVELDEGGHTDVISAKNQVKVAKSALQKMETELNKLSDESALPSWWTNKVAIAVDKLDGMADYLDTQVERKMTDAEMAKREKIVKSFKKKKDDFKDRYGDDAEDVMYATATKMAMKQEQPTTSTAGIAGLDIGLTKKKKEKDVEKAKMLRRQYLQGDKMSESIQRATFAGKDVFIVDSETFYNCRMGKKQYARYEKYVGDGMVGQAIREYGLKYPRRPIILQNGEAGPMLYLKYGRN